ncbi:MAG: DUF2062 domain-containing protein [Betaproteobacteria bacterium HGW-Betaproteobacteria-11]|nr:MAG: DUF2062 domain-containing protein [Betaproteobacteria bacterium HGW-Betaproteobacteria-11]
MRTLFKRFLPNREIILHNRYLAPFATTLLHPRLWHLNRRSAAGAMAVGLFCGLIPGPLQMLGASICAVLFRINLPLALIVTFYTNPLTIVPLYVLAYEFGKGVLGGNNGGFSAPPEMHTGLIAWSEALTDWMAGLGAPLALGLLLLASTLALTGYGLTRLVWRFYLVRAWRRRRWR